MSDNNLSNSEDVLASLNHLKEEVSTLRKQNDFLCKELDKANAMNADLTDLVVQLNLKYVLYKD